MQLDHIAVSGGTLDEARECVEGALGIKTQVGGEHDVFFTHNRLLGLEDGLYLEAISINPLAPTPDRPRWFDLDRFSGGPRLTNWICRCDDLEETLASMPEGMGEPVDLQRGDLRWRMAVPQSGSLPFDNCAPALIEWQTELHPAKRLVPSGLRLTRFVVQHPQIEALADALSPHLRDDRIVFAKGPAGLQADFKSPWSKRAVSL